MSNNEFQQQSSYKAKIFKSLDRLNLKLRPSFTKALNPHKFNLEIFIPKSMKINPAYKSKRFLRNRLINFNDDYNVKKQFLSKINEQTSAFSNQYKNVTEDKDSSRFKYLESINEIYKMKGYDIKNEFFQKVENTFKPSFLLSDRKNIDMVCLVEDDLNQKRDVKYLEKVTKIIKDKKTNTEEDEKEQKIEKKIKEKANKVQFNTDDYEKAMAEMKKKIMEELRLKNMSTRELRRMNYNILQENKRTEQSITQAEKDYYNKHHNKKTLRLIDDIFLSSKGMIRSAKKREEDDNSYDNYLKIEDNKRDDILYPDNIFSEKERRNYFQRRKQNKLQKVYNDIINSNYAEQEGAVKGFLKRYTNRKVEKPNPKFGSNLHGFLGEFQKKISLNDVPKIAKEINFAKRDYYRRNNHKNNNLINFNSANYTLIDVENMYDVEEEINNLGYKYTEDLLKLK
jgi:hypothetical protein